MTYVSREWATPLTIGAFALMAITGLLMFFHLDSGVQKFVHEWLGWLLVAAVAAHAAANWLGFKRYLLVPGRGWAILGVCALVLVGTFLPVFPAGSDASAPVLAMRAVSQAPLSAVAALAGKSVEQLQRDLDAAGIHVGRADQSMGSVIKGDREQLGRAMRATFQSQAPSEPARSR